MQDDDSYLRRFPGCDGGWPCDEERRTRIDYALVVDSCVWGAFVFVREANGGVILDEGVFLWRLVDEEVQRSHGFLRRLVLKQKFCR